MNIWIWILSVGFFIEQNSYFGWNWLPKSDAELIADGIGCVLVALAFMSNKED